jgi:hypothetical protein
MKKSVRGSFCLFLSIAMVFGMVPATLATVGTIMPAESKRPAQFDDPFSMMYDSDEVFYAQAERLVQNELLASALIEAKSDIISETGKNGRIGEGGGRNTGRNTISHSLEDEARSAATAILSSLKRGVWR